MRRIDLSTPDLVRPVPHESAGLLRGAGVDVDARRVSRFLGAAVAVLLAVVAVVLAIAGAEKNAAIDELRQQGVGATIVVTHCLGLMGGSGSNLAGYECSGALTLGGRRYAESIPGDSYLRPGASIPALAVPGHPPLVSTVSALAGENASMQVFLAPAVIGLVLLLAAAAAWAGQRRRGRQRLREAVGGV